MAPIDDAASHGDDPAYDADGVDVSLIRWMLSMSATDRLLTLQAASDAMTALREAGEAARIARASDAGADDAAPPDSI